VTRTAVISGRGDVYMDARTRRKGPGAAASAVRRRARAKQHMDVHICARVDEMRSTFICMCVPVYVYMYVLYVRMLKHVYDISDAVALTHAYYL
jgi:hypothetical protein